MLTVLLDGLNARARLLVAGVSVTPIYVTATMTVEMAGTKKQCHVVSGFINN